MVSRNVLLQFAELVEKMASENSEQQLLDILAERIPHLLPVSRASIQLYHFDEKRIQTVALSQTDNALSDKLGDKWINSVLDFDNYVLSRQSPGIKSPLDKPDNLILKELAKSGYCSTMHSPLSVGSSVLGSINIGSTDVSYQQDDLKLLMRIASLTSSMLLGARQREHLEMEARRQKAYVSKLELLNTLAGDLSLVNSVQTALEQIAEGARKLVQAERISYCELAEDQQSIILSGLVANSSDTVGVSILLEDSGLDAVLLQGERRYRLLNAQCKRRTELSLFNAGFHHVWSEPIMCKGEIRAALNLLSSCKDINMQDTNATIATLAKIFGNTLERLDAQKDVDKKHKQMELLARTDQLTGLANRYEFESELSTLISDVGESGSRYGIAFFDIDWFKNINDTLGHGVGDTVLQRLAVRLKGLLPPGDMAARIGGDEFLVLMEMRKDEQEEDLKNRLNLIARELKQPIQILERELSLSFSMGLAIYPEHGLSASELIKNADIAMYEAKKRGRDGIWLFDTQLSIAVSRKVQLEAQLKLAISKNEFSLVYQPKYDLDTRRVVGLEALLRWNNAKSGNISPEIFIPIAEEINLIDQITSFVMERSLKDLQDFRQIQSDLNLAVNVSASEFSLQSNLLTRIQESLKRTKSDPKVLEIELTETALLRNPAQAQNLIKSLSDMGISVALDDFGTGYASLTYLTQLPINTIKIDRSFIDGLLHDSNKQAVVNGVGAMARDIGASIVAEGVETAAQRDWLMNSGCRTIQGYLVSKPLAKGAMLAFLQRLNSVFEVEAA